MSEIEEIVEKAKAPGTFKIVDVLKERAYPTDTVDVFIDEDIAFTAADIDVRIRELDDAMDKKSLSPADLKSLNEKRDELISKRDALVTEMGNHKYVFHIQGISEGLREEIEKKAIERYPIKHEVDRNPLTGEVTRREIRDEDRLKLFTTLLWQAHISKIVAPDGSVQEGITVEDAFELRRSLPLASISRVTEAIDKIRAATAYFMLTVNEDFLAKS